MLRVLWLHRSRLADKERRPVVLDYCNGEEILVCAQARIYIALPKPMTSETWDA
jgi:hypothetical protein